MKQSLSTGLLINYVYNQLCSFFPDTDSSVWKVLNRSMKETLERTFHCFSHINDKYFDRFDHLHGDQYAMFLYFLSNTIKVPDVSKRLYLLNKCLHGIDIFYEVKLPDIFLLVHPVGTVLGRAEYSDYFLVYHNCSVGSNKNIFPTIGKYFTMHPGSMFLGSCVVQEYCSLGAKALLIDSNLDKCLVYKGMPHYSTVGYGGNMPGGKWK